MTGSSLTTRSVLAALGAGLDGGGHRCVEMLGPDQLDEAGFIELLTHLLGGARHLEGDVAGAEPLVNLPDRFDCTGVNPADRSCIEYQVPHRFGGPIHCCPQTAFEEVRVGEEEPFLDSVDDDAAGDSCLGVSTDVCIPVFGFGVPQDGVAGSRRSPNHVDDRQRYRHHDCLQNSDADDEQGRDCGDADFNSAAAGQLPPLSGVDEFQRREHDHRAQDR